MTNDESVIREVDQELAHERQWEYFRKHGPALIGAAILVVAVVGGWQFFNYSKAETAKQSALEYNRALEVLAEDPAEGMAALDGVINNASGGYPVLAQLQRAATLASDGDRMGALAAFRAVAADGRVSKNLRDLARLRAAYLLLPDGRDAVAAELGALSAAQSQFGFYAREVEALAALESEDYDRALVMFRSASINLLAPEPLRQRAEELAALAAAGKAGVNISGKVRTDDLLRVLGETPNGDQEAAPSGAEEAPADAGQESDPAEVEDAPATDGQESDASESGASENG